MASEDRSITEAGERADAEVAASRGDFEAFVTSRPELADARRRLHALFARFEEAVTGPFSRGSRSASAQMPILP